MNDHALPWEHFISKVACESAPQFGHPCPVSKSLQPPEHDNNHWSSSRHSPILIPSLPRGLSVRLITFPVESGFEVSFWQKRFAP